MTGIAVMVHGPSHDFPGAIEFVIVVLVIILAIFWRMYGPRRRPRPGGTRKTPRRLRVPSKRKPGRSPASRSRYGYRDD